MTTSPGTVPKIIPVGSSHSKSTESGKPAQSSHGSTKNVLSSRTAGPPATSSSSTSSGVKVRVGGVGNSTPSNTSCSPDSGETSGAEALTTHVRKVGSAPDNAA